MSAGDRSTGRFGAALGALLAAGALARVLYVIAQPAHDPTFSKPMLDGAWYWGWAEAIRSGAGGPSGVYYLGPLYPFVLAALRAAGAGFAAVYLVQHAMMLGVAAILALVARRVAGDGAGLAAAAIVLLYHPGMFFASRPLSEPLGLLLLAAAILAANPAPTRSAASGLLAGLSALARPSFLLVPVVWLVAAAARKRAAAAIALLAGALVAVLPVTLRNLAVSGHAVPVSANSGIVLWLGNAPGAVGVYVPAEGFSGDLATQQAEARVRASAESGRALDDVEADRYWRDKALRARLADPLGTAALVFRRVVLSLDDAEQGLDYAPALDANPLRRAAPLPFALVLGLAVAGLVFGGLRGSGGGALWGAVVASLATPWIFYVSSRHRLPAALLLAVPAGTAVTAALRGMPARRKAAGIALGLLAAGASFAFPTGGLVRVQNAAALANLAAAYHFAGDDARSEQAARRALELDPGSANARYNLAVVVARRGDTAEAERLYRGVVEQDPGHAEAAGNLAGILVARGEYAPAVALLRRALAARPGHAACRANLVVALAASGDLPAAREAAAEAARAGVVLDPELLRAIGDSAPGSGR